MTTVPKVSVVITTYNRAKFLQRVLTSVFDQTASVHEVIVVDDGSTDETPAVMERLLRANTGWKSRLRHLKQANLGKSAALNHALRLATGDWIAFDDSDDVWAPGKLALQFEALRQHADCRACATDVRYVNDPEETRTAFERAGRKASERFGVERDVPRLYMSSVWPGFFMQTLLVSAEAMREVGEFDASIRMSMDTDFMFRLGLVTPVCFVNLPMVQLDRTPWRTIGLTTEFPMGSVERLEAHIRIFSRWLPLIRDARPRLARQLVRKLGAARSALANVYIMRGDFPTAQELIWKSLLERKSPPLAAKYALSFCAPRLLQLEVGRRVAAVARQSDLLPRTGSLSPSSANRPV